MYFLTCACVDLFASLLARLPTLSPALPPVKALHGRMKQAAREATLASFAALPAGECVCLMYISSNIEVKRALHGRARGELGMVAALPAGEIVWAQVYLC